MLHECLNGLYEGMEKSRAPSSPSRNTRARTETEQQKRRINIPPISPIPVGSGNGVATSLFGRNCGPHGALSKIIAGSPTPIDILSVTVDEDTKPTLYDLHFFCWAAFSDHDFMTEHQYRNLGPMLKMIIAPLIVIFRKTIYQGTCDFVPVDCPKDLVASGAYTGGCDYPVSPLGEGMRRIEEGFWCFAAGNLLEAGGGLSATPNVKQSEGAVDILMVTSTTSPNLSRWRCLTLFLEMETGKHVFADDVRLVKTKKFILRTNGAGHCQLSGQEIKVKEKLEVEVLKGAMTVMM